MRLLKRQNKRADPVLETLSDEALLARIAAHDEAAFDCFYRRHYRPLLRFLRRVARQPELADEVLSDTMMTVWEKASSFAGRSQVSTWVTGIAYRKAIKRLAQAGRHETVLDDDADLDALSDDESPEATVMADDARQQLSQALLVLSPAHRAVVELAYFHGYSYPEIATLTDCPVNTVKTRMFHARSKLRTALENIGVQTDLDN